MNISMKSILKSGVSGAVASAMLLMAIGTAKAGSLPYTTTGTFSGADASLSGSQLTFNPLSGTGSASLKFAGVTSSDTASPISLGTFTLTDTFTTSRLLTDPTDAFTLKVTDSTGAGGGSVTSTSLLGLVSYHTSSNSLEIDFDSSDTIVIGNQTYQVDDVFFTPAIGQTALTGSISVHPQDSSAATPLPAPATAGLGLLTAMAAASGLRKTKKLA